MDGLLEDYTRYFINRHFHINPAFSLLNEKLQGKPFNSGNDVTLTVVSICETFVLEKPKIKNILAIVYFM